ncbi:MAG: STAS domain-containing protein [Fibrobacteria bacterium]
MRDEDQFPTVKFQKCGTCGHVYTGFPNGVAPCPNCHAPAKEKAPPGGQIRLQMDGPHALFTISGNLYKIQELEELRSQINDVVAADALSIAFAFEYSSFLNSSTINLLVKTMQTLSVHGKPTFIITSEREVLESLEMMDLDRVMRIMPTVEKYRAALA